MKFFLKFLGFLALLASCADDEKFVPDADSAYFPLEKGMFHIYSVEEVRYRVGEEPEEMNYQLMTFVADSFESHSGQVTYVIHRSIRDSGTDAWQAFDTWSARKDRREIVVSEGNIAYVKLHFPLRDGNTWNGNALNTSGQDEYELQDTGQPFQLDDVTFDNTVTVEQEANDDIIVSTDLRKEVYARGVGLVYREIVQLEYCTADACLGQQKIEEGLRMKMTITEYGRQ